MIEIQGDEYCFKALKEGDRAAFDLLFRRYYTPLCRLAITISGSEDQAEEAVQNVFVRLWEKRSGLVQSEQVKGYLFRSVYNESLWLLKKQRSQKDLEKNYALNPPVELYGDDHEKWEAFRPIINQAVENLPQKCRHIFLMRRQEGLTNMEIAEYLGISVKTVENQMTIAVKKLREDLKPYIHHLPIFLFVSGW